jgi:ABC-2 type transport system permease protein
MLSVYKLTLRQLASLSRLAIMATLAAMPVGITMLMLRDGTAPSVADFEQFVLSTMFAGSIVPLVVLAIAAVAFSNEVEDKTLANLTLSPLPRWRIALPKLLAAITVAAPLIVLSALLTAHIAFLGEWKVTIAITVAALAAVAMYASLFVWLGLASPQAVGAGLLYVVIWEGFFSQFVTGVRLLSIRHYSIALMHVLDARRFAEYDHLNTPTVLVMVTLVIGGFFVLTIRRLKRMDVP